jgi:hypothetical protein
VVHCDIKPSNILLRRTDGTALVTDFGLARLVSDRTQSMPNVAGTVPYMSPEQLGLNGASVGRASDVYSLTAVLYEMLTGEPPYGRGMEALSGHYGRYALRPVSGGRQGLPAALDGVLARGLSQDPAQRPASAGALVREVDALVADEPTRLGAAPAPPPPPQYAPPPPRYTPPPAPPQYTPPPPQYPPQQPYAAQWPRPAAPPKPRGGSSWLVPVAIVSAVLLVLGAAWGGAVLLALASQNNNGTAGQPTPTPGQAVTSPPSPTATPSPSPSGLVTVAYDDDFGSNKGWVLNSGQNFNVRLRQGNPGTLDLSVATNDAYFELTPDASTREALGIGANLTMVSGNGDTGVACKAPVGDYEFWLGPDGASIDRDGTSGDSTITLTHKADVALRPGDAVTLGGICIWDGSTAHLALEVNNQTVLQIDDSTFPGPYRPDILVEGPIDVAVHHFRVVTTS